MTTLLDLKFGLRGGTNRSRDVEDVAELAPVMNRVPRASVVIFLYDLGLSIQPVDRVRDVQGLGPCRSRPEPPQTRTVAHTVRNEASDESGR